MLFWVLASCSKDDAIYQEVNTTYTAANPVDTTLKVEVYPNPFESMIIVGFTLNKTENTTMEIINQMGQVIYKLPTVNTTLGNNQIVLDLSNLASGLYFLQVKSGNRSIIKKILKA